MPSDISVVIPTWNGRHLLAQFLPSVLSAAAHYASTTSSSVEVVVVDDGSTDDTVAWLTETARTSPVPIRVASNGSNLGFGAAVNRGVHEAAHSLVILLNNDVEVDRDAVGPLAACFERDSSQRLFAAHCRVVDFESGREVGTGKMGGFARGFLRVHQSFIARGAPDSPLLSIFASGGSAMFHRTAFIELGGFDPLFAPFYLEDVELSYRAWKQGWTVVYEPRSLVRHRFSSTIEPAAGRSVAQISQRNRLILHWIHLHDRRFMASHLLWTLALLVSAPLTLKLPFVRGFFGAVGRLGRIRERRREERRAAVRSDREVLALFGAMRQRPDVVVYDNPKELDKKKAR